MFLRCRRNHQRKSKTSTVSDPSTTPSKNIHRTKKRRSRSKPRRKMKIDPLHSHVGIDIPNAEEWRVKRIPDHSKPLAWVKRDSKWFLGTTGPYMDFAVPYLDRLGREVGMQLYADQSTLPSYVASYLSTRIRRIRVEVMNDKKKFAGNTKMELLHLVQESPSCLSLLGAIITSVVLRPSPENPGVLKFSME